MLRITAARGVLGALLVPLALTGCGGESGLSKAELTKQADAVCKRHYEKISAGANKLLAGGKLPTPQKFGRFAHQTLIPEYTAQIRELRELKDFAEPYKTWLANSEATRAKIMKKPALITNGANFVVVNAESDRLGLSRQCHVGPS
ncbi:MAG: hypothetical protein H0W90_08600 [Actinobacteria bacterium]|nr:hypothetical protein [Actinomycetota bacterium]